MAKYQVTLTQKGLRHSTVERMVATIRDAANDSGIGVQVEKIKLATSRADRLAEAAALVDQAKGEVEELREEMQDWFDGMPENLQCSDKGEQVQAAAEALEELCGNLDEFESNHGLIEFPGMY